jgi:hypothetical protein
MFVELDLSHLFSDVSMRLKNIHDMRTFARQYLKEPNGDIDSNTQRSSRLLEMFDSNFRKGYPLPRTDFLVYAMEC